MKTRLDIDIARMAHLTWEQDLEAMVLNGEITEDMQSHKDCELGTWLYKTGIKKYKNNNTINQLISTHEVFHTVAERIMYDRKNTDSISFKMDLKKIRELSREIIFHLTIIELSSLEMQRRNQFLSNPIKSLLKRLFENTSDTISGENKILEIGHARLVHLQWSRNLLAALHDWGKNSPLESVQKCALGAWIQSVGLTRHKSMPEIQKLDKIHQLFDTRAEEKVRALRKKNVKKSDQNYMEMLNLSSEVIYLLSVLELHLVDSDDTAPPINIFG